MELGGTSYTEVLSRRLHMGKGAARRRIADAEQLAPRRAITGEQLAPQLPHTAQALGRGDIGEEHARIIRHFFDRLPTVVDAATREAAEAQLAVMATEFGSEALRVGADRMMALLNPGGQFSDADRARRRGITIGPQGFGMSAISGLLDPETRAYLDAVFAKLAAPGMCNPNDQSPLVDGQPADDAAERDTRTVAQRHHDALRAALRSTLVSTELGSHHGLPVTVIVTTTLKELQDAAGIATTGSGTRLPMRDLIRAAAHAHHYLAIFDDHGRALHLGRSQRIASPGSAPRATRPRPWLHPPRLPCARIPLPSPPHHRMRPRRPHRHRQPNKP
ncbi:Conserved protein of uncharacterised function possible rep13e12 repeat protein [Mycobacteroides abscessus subsp. bolletii]|nr:Conserved protein of uncharacterised function possible rep13e12 repeat protein [Mycobacteroides abscessus]SIC27123.1 Conserved protein of uncharacterised function possible rep13e12 repeat protein [Mycobacteroides abscessus subsp. bolletii]SIJ66685.1 Conserved protein of uncharacterised function possible rep13e12 repeat protein [Mycobacteroides abscessus subsp. bolletii]SKF29704.1 Conserved protein of uncharacterised function possible rep13e12 repeat protein [Mycobacteroides abscessus subsp. b